MKGESKSYKNLNKKKREDGQFYLPDHQTEAKLLKLEVTVDDAGCMESVHCGQNLHRYKFYILSEMCVALHFVEPLRQRIAQKLKGENVRRLHRFK